MIDMSATIAPKSDQLNSDDLIGGPRTIRITKVAADPSSAEQPIAIYFDGDNGKPFKPCKSMRRVMVNAWGKDATHYAGRSLTLYRDAEVVFGGLKVGGTRISHMSHIDNAMTMALTATRASRKPYTVKPLVKEMERAPTSYDDATHDPAEPTPEAQKWAAATIGYVAKAGDRAALAGLQQRRGDNLAAMRNEFPDLAATVDAAIAARLVDFDAADGE